ncbi:nitroreductase [Olsenella sp. DSM 107455]|uniref:Nitroreductase n=1 Tax=Thermophilibacter gallinarum TaxID=2779357 RepID=A0ABR9QRW4_9ACTN|nr:nitroreductase [Thermophilibacter gallinarum]MBE5023830.1 nitroreductase [Thermophilibacter gallinarum]
MNEVIRAMEERRSVRAYTDEVPSTEQIETVVEAGLWAASGMGQQDPIIVAVTNRELRDRLSAMNAGIIGDPDRDPFYGAPVVLVVLAPRDQRNRVYDGSLVMGNLMLAAHALGLGSCWIHRAREEFDTPEGKAILAGLGIEGDYEGIGHCILGYPAEVPDPKPRREGRVFLAE